MKSDQSGSKEDQGSVLASPVSGSKKQKTNKVKFSERIASASEVNIPSKDEAVENSKKSNLSSKGKPTKYLDRLLEDKGEDLK